MEDGLSVEDHTKCLDRFRWTGKISMIHHLTAKNTAFKWKDCEFGADLDHGDFTQTALNRAQ